MSQASVFRRVAAPSLRGGLGWRALLARQLVHRMVAGLDIRLSYPDGTSVGRGDARSVTIRVVRPDSLYRRLAEDPKIGLAEAYLAGDWQTAEGSDLAAVMMPFAQRIGQLLPRPILALRRLVDRPLPAHQRNTVAGARANIRAHYDLSNELFAAFLDPTMSYSSALFDPTQPRTAQDLTVAQHRKIDAALDAAEVGQGTRLLEIGTGWGELAIRAAQRGAAVRTITLSQEQLELARARVTAAGLADRVSVELTDYRHVAGQYDAIVSIEMIEAVGQEYWPGYFRVLDERLAHGGTAVVQSILMPHERYLASRHSHGWIQEYIFPGGLIPSLPALEEVTQRHTALRLERVHAFGLDYAETLRRWRTRFVASWPHISGSGFDESFRRLWELYLAYCEAGFASGYLDVAQLTFRRSAC